MKLNNRSFRLLISKKWVCHNPSLGTFTVKGTGGTPHAVILFPTESCSCPSTTRCYHIIAARHSVGLGTEDTKRKINLTQLRRNTRSRSEKKSGRKAPRPGDYGLTAAPDSTASEEVHFYYVFFLSDHNYCCTNLIVKSNEGYRHIFSYIFLIIQKIIKIPEEAVNSLKRFEEDKEIDCKKKSTSNACLKMEAPVTALGMASKNLSSYD